MGDRLKEGTCINCGGPVIEANDWHCCSQCVEEIKAKALKRTKNIGQVQKINLPPRK
jgi:predicted nucleic acid-binding Zn ribbon protein